MLIGICDDNPRDCVELRNILTSVRGKEQVVSFSTGKEVLQALENGTVFELLFLDIYLPDMKGIRLAEEISKVDPGRQPMIVFVTTSRDFALQAFALRAVHYIVKPIRKEDILEVFERMPVPKEVRHGITVTFRDSSRFIYLDEIAFCESAGHKVLICLNSGETVIYYETLRNLADLVGSAFLQVTRGLLVNMDYIESMNGASCVLRNGREVLLSRRNRKEIKEAYNDFMFSRLLSGNGAGS